MFDLIPFRGEKSVWDYFDNFEKNFFQSMQPQGYQFRTDIVDEGDKYVLHAELPGFTREDIKIDLDRDLLTITAQRNVENEEKKDSYIRRERQYGSFVRRFDVSGIRAEDINARYENGVLSLELPKVEAQPLPPARQIEIQ